MCGNAAGRPACQCIQAIVSSFRVVIRIQRGCGGAEYKNRAMHRGNRPRNVSCVVFGHAFIFITCFVFFVNDNDADILKRRKQGRSGAYDHIDFTASGPLELIALFPLRKLGVHHGNPAPEMPVEAQQRLISQ